MRTESGLHSRVVIIDTDNSPLSVVFEMRGATVEVPPFNHLELRTTGPATATLRIGYGGPQGLSVFRDEGLQVEVFDADCYGGAAHYEVHVYYRGAEVGIYGSNGWIGKHGHSADANLGSTVENCLKGMAIAEMRASGRLGPNDGVTGDSWKRPHVSGGC